MSRQLTVCSVCGAVFGRRPGETSSQYRKRRTCSPRCANRLRAMKQYVDAGTRRCAWCGDEYRRNAPGESVPQFNARQFCSPTCVHRALDLRHKERSDSACHGN